MGQSFKKIVKEKNMNQPVTGDVDSKTAMVGAYLDLASLVGKIDARFHPFLARPLVSPAISRITCNLSCPPFLKIFHRHGVGIINRDKIKGDCNV